MREPKSYLIEIAGQMPDAIYERALQEVVRCRDCRFCGKGMWGNETFPVCRSGLHTFQVTWDGFCAWGERKGE